MKIGDISIHYLNGGNTKMDGGAMFGVGSEAVVVKAIQCK